MGRLFRSCVLCAVAAVALSVSMAGDLFAQTTYTLPTIGPTPSEVLTVAGTAFGTALSVAMGIFVVVLIAWKAVRSLRRSLA